MQDDTHDDSPDAPASRGRGRPTKYQPEFAEQARKLCVLGATDREVADFFGVDAATVYRWKHEFPEFCESMKVGKEAADDRVERALYHRAVGYRHEVEKIVATPAGPQSVVIEERLPPDPTSAIFWLKNRKPDQYRDKRDVEHSGGMTISHEQALRDLDD